MTVITGRAGIHIPLHVAVFVIHILLVMFMTADAGELHIVVRHGVTLRTGRPFIPMSPRIDPEILAVVIEG
jgi:hypothetical protein